MKILAGVLAGLLIFFGIVLLLDNSFKERAVEIAQVRASMEAVVIPDRTKNPLEMRERERLINLKLEMIYKLNGLIDSYNAIVSYFPYNKFRSKLDKYGSE